jgi:nitrogenase iron protein NifH
MRQIAIYGKGGSGKSTITSNVAACMVGSDLKVLQIGCDPKRDSTRAHLAGRRPPTVLDLLRERGVGKAASEPVRLDEVLFTGNDGVDCIEAGGPEPGVGCAGRGVVLTIETLTDLGVFQRGYDVVLYDVLGDVVCGGFAMPIRKGFAEEIHVVVSSEFLSLYAANNICRGIKRYASSGPARLAGVIANFRGATGDPERIERFARRIGSRVVATIDHCPIVVEAENEGQTVIAHAPGSTQAAAYADLATRILDAGTPTVPTPFSEEELETFIADSVR